MKKWMILAGCTVMLALAGCGNTTTQSNANVDTTTTYTASDVSQHATASDCWTIINQKVYNVTSYMAKHPGGNRINQACGVDASDLFNGKSRLGHFHSTAAAVLLSNYQIGVVQ
jgi:cytochrome b involved in lipid metabolism